MTGSSGVDSRGGDSGANRAFSTNPPRLPIDALREGTMADFEVVELAAASARADAFTYGEPFHLLAARLDEVADKLRGDRG